MSRAPHDVSDALLRIALTPGIGPATYARLVERFGDADAIVAADLPSLASIHGIGRVRADSIQREMDAIRPDEEREAMARRSVRLIVRGDADYPPLLAAISDPPVALWIRGEWRGGDGLAIAVVGSRRCTAYGREQAARFASLLAQCGLTIVSGGARGIDVESHRAALRVAGRTIVVCGNGLAHDYPHEHAELFEHVANGHGAIVSEYPMSVAPRAENFPRRNRIISGLSLGVLVIEAGKGSGSLITARMAAEDHGREVMAVPGRVDSPASLGGLEAIRDGWAAPVLSHADVLVQLESAGHLLRGAMDAVGAVHSAQPDLFEGNLTDGQKQLVEALRESGEPLSPDHLAARTQLPVNAVLAEVTILQIRGLIARDERGVRLRSRE